MVTLQSSTIRCGEENRTMVSVNCSWDATPEEITETLLRGGYEAPEIIESTIRTFEAEKEKRAG